MKKIVTMLAFASSFGLCAMDSVLLHEIPNVLFFGSENPHFKLSVGPTFSWYKVGKKTIYDSGNTADKLKNGRAKVVPGFSAIMDFYHDDFSFNHYHDNQLHYGFKFDFQYRKKAVINDYQEPNQTSATFYTTQDVRGFVITPYLRSENKLTKFFNHSLSLGLGLSFNPVNNLKVYEKNTNAYIGQRLKANRFALLPEIGYALSFYVKEKHHCKLGYNFGCSRVKYKRKIILETPSASASSRFQGQAFLSNKDFVKLAKKPKLILYKHQLSFIYTLDF